MKNSSKLIFLFMTLFSTMIILSSSSWLGAWMGLEVNLICFISFALNNKSSNSVEALIIYFLIQTMASIFFLFSAVLYMKFLEPLNLINSFKYLMLMALFMKIGAAPFHFWLPIVMQGINWMNNYLLMTWQKLGPLALILTSFNQELTSLFLISSMIIGSIGGLNQTSLKKMMAFSSINQISWLLISMMVSKYLWMMYYMFYFFTMLNIILIFNLLNLLHISQFMNLKMNPTILMFIFFSIFSMGGLPPMLGFYPKMMIIMNLNNNFLMLMVVLFSLITLFYYLRLMYFSMFLNNLKKNKTFSLINTNWIMMISSITNMFLMIMILI